MTQAGAFEPRPTIESLIGAQGSGLPWIPVNVQMHDHAMTLAGMPAREYYRNAETFFSTYSEVAEYYAIDVVRPFADVYNFEIEAMGGHVIHSEDAMPTIDFRDALVKEPEDLLTLKTPDFFRDGRLRFAMDCIRMQQKPYGRFCGIFSMAVGMRSYPALIKDMRKRPGLYHDLLTFIVDEVLIPYLEVQKDYCGITTAYGSDAWASVPNLSVDELMQWVVPYNRQLADKAEKMGVVVSLGTGDYCEEDPDKFDEEVVRGAFEVQMASRGGELTLGMGSWHRLPLEPVREHTAEYRAAGTPIAIRAGVNARLLRDGPVEAIVAAVRRYVDVLARDHVLSIWLSNIPADAPSEHVHAAVAAVHTYGRLPIGDDLDAIAFEPPQRETYQEWVVDRAGGNRRVHRT